MSIISLKIPEQLAAQLEQEAERANLSTSCIVREALAMYFAARPTERRSFLDLAGDLVGCCEGPGDLSTNKAYFEGFGE